MKAEEAPSHHEVRLTPLDTNPLFQFDSLAKIMEVQYKQEVISNTKNLNLLIVTQVW